MGECARKHGAGQGPRGLSLGGGQDNSPVPLQLGWLLSARLSCRHVRMSGSLQSWALRSMGTKVGVMHRAAGLAGELPAHSTHTCSIRTQDVASALCSTAFYLKGGGKKVK